MITGQCVIVIRPNLLWPPGDNRSVCVIVIMPQFTVATMGQCVITQSFISDIYIFIYAVANLHGVVS